MYDQPSHNDDPEPLDDGDDREPDFYGEDEEEDDE